MPSAQPRPAIDRLSKYPQSAIDRHGASLFDGTSLDAWRGYKSATPSRPAGASPTARSPRTRPSRDIDVEGSVRRLRARARVEDRRRRQQRNLLPRHRGVTHRQAQRATSTGPRPNTSCSTTQGADNKTRLTCAGAAYAVYPSPAGHSEAGRRLEHRPHRRERRARRALAQRCRSCRVRTVEPGLGSEGEGRANSRNGRTSAAPSAATSRSRAITPARSPFAIFASGRFGRSADVSRRVTAHEVLHSYRGFASRGFSCGGARIRVDVSEKRHDHTQSFRVAAS